MNRWLLDTSAVLAFLNRKDPAHATIRELFFGFHGELFTTSAVLTECMYFLSPRPGRADALVSFLMETKIQLHECVHFANLKGAAVLMEKYGNLPMDFADATLVLLGQELSIYDICTLDRRGFTVFRTPSGRYFTVQP